MCWSLYKDYADGNIPLKSKYIYDEIYFLSCIDIYTSMHFNTIQKFLIKYWKFNKFNKVFCKYIL